jgi:pyrimidine operon attenuation protein / uracil phosphoribosyltransferase
MRKAVDSRPPDPPGGERLLERRVVADGPAIARMLRRIGHEIVERNGGTSELALVGIRTGGLHLAHRMQGLIEGIEGARVPLGAVDITLYRDDVFRGLPRPEIGPTELPFALDGVTVVLVDDVLFTGRTIRAALDALMDFGRPRAVQLAVLVDRGRRELPIRPDYVGLEIETAADEAVKVLLTETGHEDRVVVRARDRT